MVVPLLWIDIIAIGSLRAVATWKSKHPELAYATCIVATNERWQSSFPSYLRSTNIMMIDNPESLPIAPSATGLAPTLIIIVALVSLLWLVARRYLT